MKINIKYNSKEGAIVPEYKTAGAAGADLSNEIFNRIMSAKSL